VVDIHLNLEGDGMANSNQEREIKALRADLEMYERIIDSIHNGILVTDADGYITHFNKPYGQFLGLDPETQIGKHCTESVENSRMHLVAQTGKSEINLSHNINGQNMVVQRIPIRKDGKVIAVFGQVMFKDIKDVTKLANRLSLLESKVKLYEQELINPRSTRYTFESIISRSRSMKALKKEALKATANQFPVLITGESGTGKELFAQAIHHGSPRKLYPFVRINCAAIPRDLLESELFGYEKGAFTGARSAGKPGKFEVAHKGTIFMDEIGDLPFEMQPKLLRVLEEREFERIGGNKVMHSDFRLIAATNQDLDTLMKLRRFRKDLFYRLNVISLHIPPLRDRPSDIVPTARHLLREKAQEGVAQDLQMGSAAEQALAGYDWPGNVRELSNVLERALSSAEGDRIRRHDFPFFLQDQGKPKSDYKITLLRDVQARAETKAIREALIETDNNKAQAANLLGIHRTLLYKKMKKYGIALDGED